MKFSITRNFSIALLTTLAVAILSFGNARAQVGIGTTNPQAMLDVVASDPANPTAKDGFLMPRVTSLSQDFQEPPAVGTMVFYNGALTGNMKHTVYYYADDSNWRNLSSEIANSSDEPELFDYDEDNGGVIFWIDPNDAYHYKIVALLEFDEDYGSNSNNSDDGGICTTHRCTFGATGFEATQSWINEHATLTVENRGNFAPSAAYYYNGTDNPGSSNDGWYLPSLGEMRLIGNKITNINNAFPSNLNHDDISEDAKYWVSQDSKVKSNGDSEAVVLQIIVNDSEDNLRVDEERKRNSRRFRIVKEIGG